MMRTCWEMVPNDRPSFTDLYVKTSKYTEHIAGYLDMNFNPFAGVSSTKEDKERKDDTNKHGFDSVSIEVIPPSVETSEAHALLSDSLP